MDEFWNAIKEDLDDDLENFWGLEYIGSCKTVFNRMRVSNTSRTSISNISVGFDS